MKIGNIFKKKKEKMQVDVDKINSLKENYEKENSYMLAIPKDEEEIKNIDVIKERIANSKYFTLKNMYLSENKIPTNEIEYNGNTYKFMIYPEPYKLPEMFRVQHIFRDVDIEEIEKNSMGLIVEMEFSDNILESFHLQLKIINTIFPEVLGVIDYSAEKILSGVWVDLAAKCSTPPAPRYIFTAQAVYSSDDDVWLHTHGLNRCGLMELEVTGSTKETYENHYHVLESVASRLIDEPDSFDDGGAIFAARLSNNEPLVVTWVPWQDAVNMVKDGKLGGPDDRTDEEGHNGYTGTIVVYQSPEDMDNGNYSPLSVYDELLKDNPMFMLTNEETARMKALALERVDYMKRAFNNSNVLGVLVKVGLTVDDEYKNENNSKEHIWFDLKSVDEKTFTAELTQEPYMVKAMHTGDMATYPYEDITDWLIFTEEGRISSDEVYLMDMK